MFDEHLLHHRMLLGWCALAAGAFFALLATPAPYGRFFRQGWGPGLNGRLGWFLMESPAGFVVGLLFVVGGRYDPVSALFCLIWCGHYVYRAIVYPLRLRSSRLVSLFVVVSAIAFNVINGYLQGRYLFNLSQPRPADWLRDPRFLIGGTLFAVGLTITITSDNTLRLLRTGAKQEYLVPRGGLFRWISCPNYFGELLEWTAWAVLTWSPPGLVFAFWTAANLVPRALAYHRWYRDHFEDYPARRKAIIPFLL